MRRSLWSFVAGLIVAGIVVAQVVLPGQDRALAIGDSTRPYVLSSPIFSPKSSTSFTTLFTSIEDVSMSMLLRRYDAVGTLLTSQAITIGAHGSLQASPAAHSGAPLHVEIWAPRPHITMRITYTDGADVARIIEWGDMIKPTGAGSAFTALNGSLVCDTRNNSNATPCEGSAIGSNSSRTFAIGGLGGLPASGLTAVRLVAQVVSATQPSRLTFFPAGSARPNVINVMFPAGSTTVASEEVTTKITSAGHVTIYNKAGTTNLLLYATGYYV